MRAGGGAVAQGRGGAVKHLQASLGTEGSEEVRAGVGGLWAWVGLCWDGRVQQQGSVAGKQQNSVEGSVEEGVAVLGKGCLGRGSGGTRQNSCMCVACYAGCGCISGLVRGFIAKNGVLIELETTPVRAWSSKS